MQEEGIYPLLLIESKTAIRHTLYMFEYIFKVNIL